VSSEQPARAPAPRTPARRPAPTAPSAPPPGGPVPGVTPPAGPAPQAPSGPRQPRTGAGAGPAAPGEQGIHKITDARAMRALAHPLRIALLEALVHVGTLTATQASELLGESPANCAFHLRTLGKYGYVVEAGGGKGRERPWRRAHNVLHITTDQEDPLAAMAAEELGQFWLETVLDRARAGLSLRGSWPAGWQHNALLGESEHILYVTPQEAAELGEEIFRLFRRYDHRVDHPERRPADAMPIESLVLSYPLLHLASWPATGAPAREAPAPGGGTPTEPGEQQPELPPIPAEGASPCIPRSPAASPPSARPSSAAWLAVTGGPGGSAAPTGGRMGGLP
jgi:DNA-binding transcriptional ArsR family regulator